MLILFVIYCYIDFLWTKVAKVCSRLLLRSWKVAGLNLYLETCNADKFLFVFLRLSTHKESLKLQYRLFSYSHPGAFKFSSSQELRLQYGYKTCDMFGILRIIYQILNIEIASWHERRLKNIFRAIWGQLLDAYMMRIRLKPWFWMQILFSTLSLLIFCNI